MTSSLTSVRAESLSASLPFPTRSRAVVVAFWVFTAIFCLQMGFTAYAELRLPQVAEEFARLGFPAYFFRLELSWAKVIGIALLLAPVPARLKEWAYAGFAINLVSAVFAHLAIGEGPAAWGWAVGTGVLWALSYYFWDRRGNPAAAPSGPPRVGDGRTGISRQHVR